MPYLSSRKASNLFPIVAAPTAFWRARSLAATQAFFSSPNCVLYLDGRLFSIFRRSSPPRQGHAAGVCEYPPPPASVNTQEMGSLNPPSEPPVSTLAFFSEREKLHYFVRPTPSYRWLRPTSLPSFFFPSAKPFRQTPSGVGHSRFHGEDILQ